MKVISVNVGQAQSYDWRGGEQSAMVKSPVKAASLTKLGFEGDVQVNTVNHGGPDKAVLVLPAQNYALFKVDQPFGYLGENLTIEGLDETQVCIGDQLHLNGVILEVTQPRSPCWKLDALTGRKDLLKIYGESGRVGFYCRVLQTGQIQSGDPIQHFPAQNLPGLVIFELFLAKLHAKSNADIALLNQAIGHPKLSEAWKTELQKLLVRIQKSCHYQ